MNEFLELITQMKKDIEQIKQDVNELKQHPDVEYIMLKLNGFDYKIPINP